MGAKDDHPPACPVSWLRPRTGLPRRPFRCPEPGCTLDSPHRHLELSTPPEAYRPLPGANAWPDDAVLLTYAELRRLVALHLDLVAQTMPHDRPWAWVAVRAGAVRDGEAPLLIGEVLDRPAAGIPPG